MDTKSLVAKLKELFSWIDSSGVGFTIDSFGLAPAYAGILRDVYVLGISAPSDKINDRHRKLDVIIEMMYEKLDESEIRMIDRIRVYNSISELKANAKSNFDNFGSDTYEQSIESEPELFEVA